MQNKYYIFLLICLFNMNTFTHNEPLCISLGSNCTAAFHMKNFNLRTFAYPFDWILSTDIQGLFKILRNDFKDFFLKENLIDSGAARIKDTIYNMIFVHDFPYRIIENNGQKYPEMIPSWQDHYPIINQKYMRRVERFKELKREEQQLLFFRYFHTTKAEAIELKTILDEYLFPKKFTLIVIGNTQEYKEDWRIEGIKNFYFNAHSWAESSKSEQFVSMCSVLNIKLTPNKQQLEMLFFDAWF